jgi:4-hydroxybenzoate polyprenyltransferase
MEERKGGRPGAPDSSTRPLVHSSAPRSEPSSHPLASSPSASSAPSAVNPIVALLQAMRPKQWVKNGFLFAGILFTLDQRHSLADWLRVVGAFAVFCALSSAIYLVNDLCDLEQDRRHPRKKDRALASGRLSPVWAKWSAVVLGVGGVAGAGALGSTGFLACAATYLGVTLAYSFWLKHVVIVDVMTLAAGFVLRAAAGAAVIGVEISPWLLVCTTLLALFLGLAKRRTELALLQDEAAGHRRILEEYSIEMLDQLINIVAASVLMAYSLYTFNSRTAQGRPLLMLTLPFVIYGLFRFLYLIHRRQRGGSPTADLLEDWPLLVTVILWAVTSAVIMAFDH